MARMPSFERCRDAEPRQASEQNRAWRRLDSKRRPQRSYSQRNSCMGALRSAAGDGSEGWILRELSDARHRFIDFADGCGRISRGSRPHKGEFGAMAGFPTKRHPFPHLFPTQEHHFPTHSRRLSITSRPPVSPPERLASLSESGCIPSRIGESRSGSDFGDTIFGSAVAWAAEVSGRNRWGNQSARSSNPRPIRVRSAPMSVDAGSRTCSRWAQCGPPER